MRCDLCGADEPQWLYPDLDRTQKPLDFEPRTAWAICEECHLLVQQGDPGGILERAERSWRGEHRYFDVRPRILEMVHALLENLIAEFFQTNKGEPRRVSSN